MEAQEFYKEVKKIFLEYQNDSKSALMKSRSLFESAVSHHFENAPKTINGIAQKIDFLSNKFNLQFLIKNNLGTFRIYANKANHSDFVPNPQEFMELFKFMVIGVSEINNYELPDDINKILPAKIEKFKIGQKNPNHYTDYLTKIIENDTAKKILTCTNDDEPYFEVMYFKYNHAKNEAFNSANQFQKDDIVRMIGCELDPDNPEYYIPKYMVLDPDYLVDISSLASCNKDFASSANLYFYEELKSTDQSSALLKGNIANTLIDQLITKPNDADFKTIFKNTFQSLFLEFSSNEGLSNDEDFRSFMESCQMQFDNLKLIIQNIFPNKKITPENLFIEPSFICPHYGIQGRLDLLWYDQAKRKAKVIELKSGKLPYPETNLKKINRDNLTQLQLYGLMIQRVYNLKSNDIELFVLYSAATEKKNPLRIDVEDGYKSIAPALNLRNWIVINRNKFLDFDQKEFDNWFTEIDGRNIFNPEINSKLSEMIQKQFLSFRNTYLNSSRIEKSYFNHFYKFNTNELNLAKNGQNYDFHSNTGFSGLWNQSLEDKEAKMSILYGLKIKENLADKEDKKIILQTQQDLFYQSGLRIGDIVLLFQQPNPRKTNPKNQVLVKCTIQSIKEQTITLICRHRQANLNFFDNSADYVIEPDFMETSYHQAFKGLFHFLEADSIKKELLLGIKTPTKSVIEYKNKPYLDEVQNKIIHNAISANDYYLIWGPPGTGKTSIALKEITAELFKMDKNILICAFTNRAVDEICSKLKSIQNIIPEFDFIRVSSNNTSNPEFSEYLLDNKLKITSRKEVKNQLQNIKVFVGTSTSLSSKNALFSIKKFDALIVDEAAQILEPNIIGLITKVDKFILIGDHKQLPAISLQKHLTSKINDQELNRLGFENCQTSLFERLLNHLKSNNLTDYYGKLLKQGRMHKNLMEFVNESFYENELETFDLPHQNEKLNNFDKNIYFYHVENEPLKSTNNHYRNPIKLNSNKAEAEQVKNIVQELMDKLNAQPNQIGIITPFKSQIATIKGYLQDNIYNDIVIDTVERFQGSEKDYIIISTVIDDIKKLPAIMQKGHHNPSNKDGLILDRKLNVAITRAKKLIFMVGNKNILSFDHTYKAFIEHIQLEHQLIE